MLGRRLDDGFFGLTWARYEMGEHLVFFFSLMTLGIFGHGVDRSFAFGFIFSFSAETFDKLQ